MGSSDLMARIEQQVVRFDGLFEAKTEALREALLGAVQDLEPLLLASAATDDEAMQREREWVHTLANEADALLITMVRLAADSILIAEAERIFDSLRNLERRIEAALKLARK